MHALLAAPSTGGAVSFMARIPSRQPMISSLDPLGVTRTLSLAIDTQKAKRAELCARPGIFDYSWYLISLETNPETAPLSAALPFDPKSLM